MTREILTRYSAYKPAPEDIFIKLEYNDPANTVIQDSILEFPDKGEKAHFVSLLSLDYSLVLGANYQEIMTIGEAANREDATKEQREKGDEPTINKLKLFNNRLTYGTYLELYLMLQSLRSGWIKESILKGYPLNGLGGRRFAHVPVSGHRRSILTSVLIKEEGLDFEGFPLVKVEEGSNEEDWIAEQYYGNRDQKEFSKLEIAEAAIKIMRKSNRDEAYAAQKLRINPIQLKSYIGLRAANPKVVDFVLRGKISDARAIELIREFPDNYVDVIAQMIEEAGGKVDRSRASTNAVNRIKQKVSASTKTIKPEQVNAARNEIEALNVDGLPVQLLLKLQEQIKNYNEKIEHLSNCWNAFLQIDALGNVDEKTLSKVIAKPILKELKARGLFDGKALKDIGDELTKDLDELKKTEL